MAIFRILTRCRSVSRTTFKATTAKLGIFLKKTAIQGSYNQANISKIFKSLFLSNLSLVFFFQKLVNSSFRKNFFILNPKSPTNNIKFFAFPNYCFWPESFRKIKTNFHFFEKIIACFAFKNLADKISVRQQN